jgi:hypothetical protein
LHYFSEQLEHLAKGKDVVYAPEQNKKIQTALNALGFTDDDGNALEVDGVFGDKSKEAYKKYLAQKNNIEKQHLDQYMTEEDAEKYRTTTTTGVGETRVIDLEQIGDGPTMINNKAVNQDIKIRGNVQTLIDAGVGVDDPMYDTLIKQQIFELNNVGPEGIKSLIFDGLRNDPDSIYNGINTDEFIEQVIRNHYGDDLTESQIAEKIELMRVGDVTQMYNNGKGGQDTLQTQFMEWYKGTIDKKIEEGIASTITTGQPNVNQPGTNQPGTNQPNTGNVPVTQTGNWNEFVGNPDSPSTIVSTQETDQIISNFTSLPTIVYADGTVHNNAELYFINGEARLISDLGLMQQYNQSNKIDLMGLLQNLYPDATDEQIRNYVNDNLDKSKKLYEDALNKDRKNVGVIKLYRKGQTIGGRKVDDYLLRYGNDEFVINSLNREYGKSGFKFKYAGGGNIFTDKDALSVEHKNFPGKTFTIRFDTASEKQDLKNTQHLMKIMNALAAGNLEAAFLYQSQNQNDIKINFTETNRHSY